MRRGAIFITLTVFALALAASERLAFWIAGYRPLATLDARTLDEPPPVDDRAAPRFFDERNQVEIEVPRDMTLGQLLGLYQLAGLPHVRAQIAAQERAATLPDSHLLRRGTRYRITLNPPAPPPEGTP